jgi:alpha-L-fucosidase
MALHGTSIYHCTQAPDAFKNPENCLLTYNAETNRIYVHLLEYPMKRFTLQGFGGKVTYAQFLHDRSEIQFGEPRHNVTYQESLEENDIMLLLPVVKPDVEIPVIELILND